MKKATVKETFYVVRTTVTEETIEVKAGSDSEAVRLVSQGKGAVLGTDTHIHSRIEE